MTLKEGGPIESASSPTTKRSDFSCRAKAWPGAMQGSDEDGLHFESEQVPLFTDQMPSK
jgi:hypothetical protein